MNMKPISVFVKLRTLPGKRDAAYAVWEKHISQIVEDTAAMPVYYVSFDDNDDNLIHIFEVYTDRDVMDQNMKAPWLQAYLDEITPLFDGDPEIGFATPIWTKGAVES